MPNSPIPSSELIVNKDGSIYHLKLRPEQLAEKVIVVGDPERVRRISRHFDNIEHEISNREFLTHTGFCNGKRISAISTGIGTDNIDIVLNELDALVNVNLESRMIKEEHTSLEIIRIGTSGAIQPEIDVNSFVVSDFGFGMDGLLHHYTYDFSKEEQQLANDLLQQVDWKPSWPAPYFIKGNDSLIQRIGRDMIRGITATSPGFYGPQGRVIRLPLASPNFNDEITRFMSQGLKVTNFEMETSALYGLGKLLGHQCCTVCVAIANRATKDYSDDYKPYIDQLIKVVLARLTA